MPKRQTWYDQGQEMCETRPIAEIIEQLIQAGVIRRGDVSSRPLAGGVSCDIWLLEGSGRRVVVKQALPKLRVRDEWYADVSRNATEQAYLRYVAGFRPDAVPRILHADGASGFFAMEYLGEGFENWKAQMLEGRAEPATARRAGALLGEIHRRSWGDEGLLAAFDTTRNFHQLRTESYLLTTGLRHPALRGLFEAEAARMESTRLCLAHGDYSPKNILVARDRIVVLDCEVAWFGEPAFDTAFLLNHLYLKALHMPARRREFLVLVGEAWSAYAEALGAGRLGDLELRTARLLLMLMLARVDGKSPVEYLVDGAKKEAVRTFVGRHLPGGLWQGGLGAVSSEWERMVSGMESGAGKSIFCPMRIASVRAFQVFDSRGNPTIEAELALENGLVGRGMVPSGASTGQYEALELRDGDPRLFRGRSVLRAIGHIEGEIAGLVRGRDVCDQEGLDRAMIALDGTPNKSRLGANAILAVSMAAADAAARARGVALFEHLGGGTLLPLPEIQIIGGGAHANWRTDVQDFLVIATGARSYEESLEITFNVFHAAGDILRERGKGFGVADEGGYWPEFATNEEALGVVVEAIERAGYTPGRQAALSLDIAASDLYDAATGRYRFRLEGREFTSGEFADLMIDWCRKYPVVSIEDPAADTDWECWRKVSAAIGGRVQLVGDDLFTTNLERIAEGVRRGAANAVLIKPNQIGTVTETLDAVRATQAAGWLPVVSARSGETEDAFIAHLAVATDAGQLKVGSFSRSERMAKWNEVLRIGRRLGHRARFEGAGIFKRIRAGGMA